MVSVWRRQMTDKLRSSCACLVTHPTHLLKTMGKHDRWDSVTSAGTKAIALPHPGTNLLDVLGTANPSNHIPRWKLEPNPADKWHGVGMAPCQALPCQWNI